MCIVNALCCELHVVSNCLPSYFEWEHISLSNGKTKTGNKYLIQPKGSSMTWLCGLYRIEDRLPVFVILT